MGGFEVLPRDFAEPHVGTLTGTTNLAPKFSRDSSIRLVRWCMGWVCMCMVADDEYIARRIAYGSQVSTGHDHIQILSFPNFEHLLLSIRNHRAFQPQGEECTTCKVA